MATYAFIELERGFVAFPLKDIKKDDVYFLMIDNEPQPIHRATRDAFIDRSCDEGWAVEGVPYEY
jgi:hypothetical protein